MPFPGWESVRGAGLGRPRRLGQARLRGRRHRRCPRPSPEGVVRLTDERRYDVPVLVICPEFSPAEAKEWVADGDLPELAKASTLDYADIDSGHWPMFTRPAELASILAAAVR